MRIADDLAGALFTLDIQDSSTAAITRRLTREVVSWAHSRGWTARTEARVGLELASAVDLRRGFIDVVIYRGRDGPDLAVEIDSADKPWSVTKLRHAVAAGMHAIWIRWGDDVWAGIYDDVDVIQLPVDRRPALKPVPSQLVLWRAHR